MEENRRLLNNLTVILLLATTINSIITLFSTTQDSVNSMEMNERSNNIDTGGKLIQMKIHMI